MLLIVLSAGDTVGDRVHGPTWPVCPHSHLKGGEEANLSREEGILETPKIK